jgi:hypothetical protein
MDRTTIELLQRGSEVMLREFVGNENIDVRRRIFFHGFILRDVWHYRDDLKPFVIKANEIARAIGFI